MSFLLGGLKYQDITVKMSSITEGNIALKVSLISICENTAPDIVKKIPAYAHSFSKGNLGISKTMVPKIFQTPSMVKK
jgi:hypothetical protein